MNKPLKGKGNTPSNVFPIKPEEKSAANDANATSKLDKPKWLLITAMRLTLAILRGGIFCLMVWARMPLRILFSFISIMAFVGVLLSWLIFDDLSMVPGFAVMGIGCTAAMMLYDYVLLWLQPSYGGKII